MRSQVHLAPVDGAGPPPRVTSIATAEAHSCAVFDDGGLRCWGLAVGAVLGFGATATYHPRPTPVGDDAGAWSTVTTGWTASCAIRADSTLWCWGNGPVGQPDSGTALIPFPRQVGAAADWSAVSVPPSGFATACGLQRSGALSCWGDNTYGQRGDGTLAPASEPTPVAGTSDWLAVSVGGRHTCGIRDGGSLYCWGSNLSSALGTDGGAELEPRLVDPGPWAQVAAGAVHILGAGRRRPGTHVRAQGEQDALVLGPGRRQPAAFALGAGAHPEGPLGRLGAGLRQPARRLRHPQRRNLVVLGQRRELRARHRRRAEARAGSRGPLNTPGAAGPEVVADW